MTTEKKWKPRLRIRPRAVVLWSLLLIVVVAILLMGKLRKPEESMTSVPEKAVLVRAEAIVPQAIHDTVVLPGTVMADVSAQLAAEKGGRIMSLAVDRGDPVTAGQVLMRIDSRHWEVYRKQAGIELADAERDLARWSKLKGEGAVSTSDFDAMQRRRDLAEVALEDARVNISQCEVISPIGGVVDARYVELGEYVSEAQLVFKIVRPDRLTAALNVPERDISVVEPGMPMRLHCAALPDVAFTGRVDFVAVAGDAYASTFAVELAVEAPPPGLKPGMMVEAELLRAAREGVIVVPFSAVVPKRGEHVVYVVQEGRAVRRVVQIDAIVGTQVVLASGVAEGELLVIEGQRTLQDGVMVSVAGDGSAGQE